MATATEAWRDYLLAQVPQIESQLDQLECTALISDSWYPLRAALDAFRGSALQSYSISGLSFSRKGMGQMSEEETQIRRRIYDLLYRAGVVLIDGRGFYTTSWPIAGGSVAT
jgi:hypothetical protein